MNPRRLLSLAALVSVLVLAAPATPASAHPLGNFTINQYAGVLIAPGAVRIDYLVDMAEIPAFREREIIDRNSDDTIDAMEGAQFAAARCAELAKGFRLEAAGEAAVLAVSQPAVTFPPGAGGLKTLRLECPLAGRFQRPLEAGARLIVQNDNYADRIGWREITAASKGIGIRSSSVPFKTTSGRLTRYPESLLQSPLDVRSAHLVVEPGVGTLPDSEEDAAQNVPSSRLDGLTQAFTGLVARQKLTVSFAFLAFAIALGLGALHALAPGHGKTLMAAYAAGQRSSTGDIVKLGLAVTVTHTIGVLILGLVLSVSAVASPERFYPPLGIIGGLIVGVIGLRLLITAIQQRRRGPVGDGHDERLGHSHAGGHHHAQEAVGTRRLIALGFAGGIVPSPSAIVVLLGAIALGRAWFGVILVIAYGLGMAGTLFAAGLLLRRARGVLTSRTDGTGMAARILGVAPFVTASILVIVGISLLARNVAQIG